MVIAVYNTISSDFGRFQDAIWILASYRLGLGPAQPLYGKLSDIFGYRVVLTFAYALFGIGCILYSRGRDLSEFAAGRVVAGMGGVGMRSLVSSSILSLVPLRDVALWRSWMYVMVTFGGGVGAPLWCILADTIGWRGSFACQAPLAVLALTQVCWKLPTDSEHNTSARADGSPKASEGSLSKLHRVDFPGVILLATFIIAFLLVWKFASKRLMVSDPLILRLFVLSFTASLLFLLVEAKYADEPILPLRSLVHRDVLMAYLIIGLLITGSMSNERQKPYQRPLTDLTPSHRQTNYYGTPAALEGPSNVPFMKPPHHMSNQGPHRITTTA
ncbi:hypothetical protein HO133_008428 [Letharia lupina]|uniref:Major facilitator superfamily (MFS) profile domain-containing protein n=1 Tax=Letharia lupina TaxID=560253 RepID=A0A8H6FFV0_9LECA|nr:uncharacterized protein HO133_008428 [Letharia lupina]KAF6226987.1 hypothetical protein HO133_008428 [Letharia lupina]